VFHGGIEEAGWKMGYMITRRFSTWLSTPRLVHRVSLGVV